jgi:hypothetical protein
LENLLETRNRRDMTWNFANRQAELLKKGILYSMIVGGRKYLDKGYSVVNI